MFSAVIMTNRGTLMMRTMKIVVVVAEMVIFVVVVRRRYAVDRVAIPTARP